MADIEIAVDGGTSKRLLTAGKYCDRNILVTATGGGGSPASVSPKDINFYDYDGTLVEAWTLEELAGKSALPANPTHDGLTAQGWNWSLEDLKTTNRPMNVGQMYVTDDGATRLHINIQSQSYLDVPMHFQQSVDRGVAIDWGDKTGIETLDGIGYVNTMHHYDSVGPYTISIHVENGCEATLGLADIENQKMINVLGDGAYVAEDDSIYQMLGAGVLLYFVEIGSGIKASAPMDASFYQMGSLKFATIPNNIGERIPSFSNSQLEFITIPNSVQYLGSSQLSECYSLSGISFPPNFRGAEPGNSSLALYDCNSLHEVYLPNGIEDMGAGFFSGCGITSVYVPPMKKSPSFEGCKALTSVTLESGIQEIAGAGFSGCTSLAEVVVPYTVTKIWSSAFRYCDRLAYVHIKNQSPPSLISSNIFEGTPSDLVIYVPKGSLSAYQSATNWATYADQMQEEP